MMDGSRSPISLRQVLWVAAGVVCLTFLVVVASWLFSPRTSSQGALAGSTAIQEGSVDKRSFTPESPGPGRASPRASTAPTNTDSASSGAVAGPAAGEPSAPLRPAETSHVNSTPASPQPAPPPREHPEAEPAGHVAAPRGLYGVQVGAFASDVNARQVQHRLQVSGYPSSVLERNNVHKVVVTGFKSRSAAEAAMADLRRKGFPKAFIVPLE